MGAGRGAKTRTHDLRERGCCKKESKKKLYWYTTYGVVSLEEQIFYQPGLKKHVRAFSTSARIYCRGYSRALERAITDFGGENAFGQVEMKLKEHYGITVPTSSARTITQRHAHEMYEQEKEKVKIPSKGIHPIILAETDGTMIPITKTTIPEGQKPYDARKHKEHFWREARLSLAHPIGSVTPIFAATLGSVDKVGQQIRTCVNKVCRSGKHA